MTVFTDRDREISRCAYQEIADAVAAAVARREATVPVVFVAAYRHRFGIDVTAHSTRPLAQAALHRIATRECSRDPALRDRVLSRFGAWPAQGLDDAALEEILADWSQVADDEALWIAECDVETDAAHRAQSMSSERPVEHSASDARDGRTTLAYPVRSSGAHDAMSHAMTHAMSHAMSHAAHHDDGFPNEFDDAPEADVALDRDADTEVAYDQEREPGEGADAEADGEIDYAASSPDFDTHDPAYTALDGDADPEAPPQPDSYDLFDAVDESDIDPPLGDGAGTCGPRSPA
jgi:hypothetical protein